MNRRIQGIVFEEFVRGRCESPKTSAFLALLKGWVIVTHHRRVWGDSPFKRKKNGCMLHDIDLAHENTTVSHHLEKKN